MSRLPQIDPTAIYTGEPTPLSSELFISIDLQHHSCPNYLTSISKFVHLQSRFQSNPHAPTFLYRASSSYRIKSGCNSKFERLSLEI